jgi:hypothetical protein
MISPAIVILIGAIVAALGAWWASNKQERDNAQAANARAEFERELRAKSDEQAESQRQLRKKSDEIASLYQTLAESQRELREKADIQVEAQQELAKKSDEIADLNRQIADAQRDLRSKSDEIAELNRQISHSLTGGDSYCYIRFMLGDTDSARMMLLHQGKYPLYDVSLRMWDPNDYGPGSEKLSFEELTKKDLIVNLGNLSPNQATLLGKVQLPQTGIKDFALSFGSRNGFVEEVIKLRRINGQWVAAYRVRSQQPDGSAVVLFEEIAKDFPLGKDGKVEW